MKPLGTLRFFLALCVLVGHAFNLIASSLPAWAESVGSISAQLGVLMFFTVSGYIICLAIEQNYSERPIAFLVNRALRIYPIHLACYGLALLFLWKIGSTSYGWVPKITREDASFLTDLLILPSSFLPNPPMWSVGVEMQFYLMMGLATLSPWRKVVYWILGVVAGLAVILDVQAGVHGYLFCFFALGGSLYYIKTKLWKILGGISLAAVLKYMLIITNRIDIPNITMTVTALIALGVFAWLVLSNRKAGKLDTFFGGLSYPLYAVHVPVLALIAQNAIGFAEFFMVCAVCIVAAISLYFAIEKPAGLLRSLVRSSPKLHLRILSSH